MVSAGLDLIRHEAPGLLCVTETWLDDVAGLILAKLVPIMYLVQYKAVMGMLLVPSLKCRRPPRPKLEPTQTVQLVGKSQREAKLGMQVESRLPCCAAASLWELVKFLTTEALWLPGSWCSRMVISL